MKQCLTIFFLATYLFSVTEAHQLLKLPVIFQHYQEHHLEDKTITPLKFLAIHYLHGSPRDKDYNRDMQLPFKTSIDCTSSIVFHFVPSTTEVLLSLPVATIQSENFISQDRFMVSAYLSEIWQPPKC